MAAELSTQSINKDVYGVYQSPRRWKYASKYIFNNWIKTDLPEDVVKLLRKIRRKGVAIWLNAKGDICYRLSMKEKTCTTSIKRLNLILNNVLEYKFEILTQKKKNQNTPYIFIHELRLISDEIFNPYMNEEFYQDSDDLWYRNTFQPTQYMIDQPRNYDFYNSITLQYIYHLANYNRGRFYYILNWLASFFQDLKKQSYIPLVLMGTKKSGKEILFDVIIKSLFGDQYCSRITDTVLESKHIEKKLTHKLFFNFDNISPLSVEDNKTSNLLKNIMYDNIIELDKSSYKEIQNYGQTLITTDREALPFLNHDTEYSVFKVADNIEDIFIPDHLSIRIRYGITSYRLIELIEDDLENFAMILKAYKSIGYHANIPYKYDDKKLLTFNLEDKILAFHNAVIEMNISYFDSIRDIDTTLYDELIDDFNSHQVKQKNYHKCFKILYPEESITSRTLMNKLRKITKHTMYQTGNFKNINSLKYICVS